MQNIVLKGEGVAQPITLVKRRRRFPVSSVVVCLVCIGVGYLFADRVGQNRLTAQRIASTVLLLDALEKLKAGDTWEATHTLERRCFADSAAVLAETGWRVEAYGKIGVASLIAYRKNYRTNEVEWTPVERKLEKLLAGQR